MTEQAKELRRQYKKEWNRKNKDRVRQHQAAYWERKAAAAEAASDPTDEPKQQEA